MISNLIFNSMIPALKLTAMKLDQNRELIDFEIKL